MLYPHRKKVAKQNDLTERRQCIFRFKYYLDVFLFIYLINSVTLYFTSLSLSFISYKVKPILFAPHTNYWYNKREMLLTVHSETMCCTAVCVVMHSPNTVLAGTDSLLSQNDTWERMTVMMQGRYVWITKYPIFLFKWKWAVITVYSPRRKF